MEYAILATFIIIGMMLIIYGMCNNFCLHIWDDDNQGYLFCTKCGVRKIKPCLHEWEQESISYRSPKYNSDGKLITYTARDVIIQCKKCKEFKTITTN